MAAKKDKKEKAKDNLRKCPKCHHRISKAASACPDCGHPIGFVGWLTGSKIILLLTGILSITGLSLIDVIFPKEEQNGQKQIGQTKISTDQNTKQKSSKAPNKRLKTKKIPCPKCKKYRRKYGKGYIPCKECNGTGTCKKCNGERYINRGPKSIKCPQCKGTGKCKKCKGTGRAKCRNCGGDGEISVLRKQ